MDKFTEALRRGQEERKKVAELQDEALALFVKHIQKIDDVATLENIIKELQGQ